MCWQPHSLLKLGLSPNTIPAKIMAVLILVCAIWILEHKVKETTRGQVVPFTGVQQRPNVQTYLSKATGRVDQYGIWYLGETAWERKEEKL